MKNEKGKNIIIVILSIIVLVLVTLLILVLTGVLNFNDNTNSNINDGVQSGENNNTNDDSNVNNSILTSSDNCINNSTICKNGTLVNVKVNVKETYNFYVINDDGKELTLIMDRNLGDNVAWISADDYNVANTDGTNCPGFSCNDEGPITAVNALKERTSSWTNIEEREYTYSNDGEGYEYTPIAETMRARMLTLKEVDLLYIANNNSKPEYLYTNLSDDNGKDTPNGYWIPAIRPSTYSTGAVCIDVQGATVFHYTWYDTRNGIRPVITVSKNI